MTQPHNLFYNNQSLFSNNYIEYHLPILWKEHKDIASSAYELIKEHYSAISSLNLGHGQEAELEDKLIRPVLSALGYSYSVQPVTQIKPKIKKRPDYALFKDENSLNAAINNKDDVKKFFSCALTITEVKYWGRRLNDIDRKDTLDSIDPTAQTIKYLEDAHYHSSGQINWAILTNGKIWRLFYYKASSRCSNFYEADLEEIIKSSDVENFMYFYLFFAKDALTADPITNKTLLDQHLKGSEDYAVRVSSKLKELIFDKVFEDIAEGFINYRKTELSISEETQESKDKLFKACLTLLYRMLFLLYAESRALLPLDDKNYRRVSFSKLKEDISSDISATGIDKMSKKVYNYWARLDGLFNIIAKGEPSMNVPIYNGGLFERGKSDILNDHKIADPFIAKAIELLTIDRDNSSAAFQSARFIDYSSLGVRHLGDIYEGLLEFHLQIADEDTVEVKDKGKSLWMKKASALKPRTKTYRRKSKGEVYIENSNHERKASGSYYTPPYIVEYMVKNTVGKALERKIENIEKLLLELEHTRKTKNKQTSTASIQAYNAKITRLENTIFNDVFDLKVLDPSMGSGHFLVHTADVISDRIIAFLAGYPENPVIDRIYSLRSEIIEEITRQGVNIDESKLTEVNLIKRMVMKRCIYGVDLNDMAVELAKLSLWLDSFTLGAPLSFLDHHLKCGNSLIGVMDISSVVISDDMLRNSEAYSRMQRALAFMIQVSELTDATIAEAKRSSELFNSAQDELAPIRRRFDVNTARHFINGNGNVSRLENLAYTLDYEKEENDYPEVIEACKNALQIAKEKRFFHWKLEFPEVFYDDKGEKQDQGFDCVIGNPPYINIMVIQDDDLKYLTTTYKTSRRRFDLYVLFAERAISLLKNTGYHSFIVPNKMLSETYAAKLRKIVLETLKLINVLNLSNLKRVFPVAAVRPIVYVLINDKAQEHKIHVENAFDESLNNVASWDISQEDLLNVPEYRIRLDWTVGIKDLTYKIDSLSFPASRILYVSWGAQPGVVDNFFFYGNTLDCRNDTSICKKRECPSIKSSGEPLLTKGLCKPLIKGASINRYSIDYKDAHIIYDTKNLHRPAFPELFENKKIVLCKVSGEKGLLASYDTDNYYTDDSVANCIAKHCLTPMAETALRDRGVSFAAYNRPEDKTAPDKVYDRDTIIYENDLLDSKNYSLLFIVALFNSSLIGFYYKKYISGELNVFPEHIRLLPIRHIKFASSSDRRAEIIRQTKTLYDNSEENAILDLIEKELSEGRNDTVHDILAYLAEQMIEMNRAKNKETKGFLTWLEREIGAEINTLTNKTKLKQYHNYTLPDLLDILKKSGDSLSIKPSNRKFQDLIEDEFTQSIAILEPLKTKINDTDKLIDQIVYKLYGLTYEEIKLVEGD
ncbi:type II DNA modification enzyme [Candidatus Magnetoovum chiemensis]|nr:type II DNA modification enzyme [Candidatus Magnetoovum chiemensis]